MSSTADSIVARVDLSYIMQQLLLVLLCGGVLSIAFLNNDRYYLAWFAFIPLLIAVDKASLFRTYILGLIAGLCLFATGMYWVSDFVSLSKGVSFISSLPLSFAVWFYCAHIIAFIFVLYNWLKLHTKIHEFFLFPVVVTAFTSAFPMIFPLHLGETQNQLRVVLQATEFVGVYGVDAIIALFNIVMFRFLSQIVTSSRSLGSWLPWTLATAIITLWFAYGIVSNAKWEKEMKRWDSIRVGLVQPNEEPKLGRADIYPGYGYSYPPELEMTERLSAAGAELVVWPEAQGKNYLNNPNVTAAFQENIAALGVSLLFQDIKRTRGHGDNVSPTQHNSAVLIDENGNEVGVYQKMMRIPFGEYLPLSNTSRIGSWLRVYLGGFLNEISKGKEFHSFQQNGTNIIPLICYETVWPSFVASAVREATKETDKAKGTLLIGLSNDGWFGSTHQPYQHIFSSVLRAVENRLPLVHVANNGPSIVALPNGQITFISDFQKAAGYIVDVPLSSSAQGSFYSRHPKLFINLLYIALILTIVVASWNLAYRKYWAFRSESVIN